MPRDPKDPPPAKNSPAAKPAPPPAPNKAGGVPGGVPKGQAALPNPDNPIDRLLRMTPEQRERAIEKFPPKQQDNFRKRFEAFDRQTEAQKQRELEQKDAFWSLPPDKQRLVRDQINAFKALPVDRRQEVRKAYVRLSHETPEGRNTILARPQFRSRFTPAELQILTVLPEYMPAPGAN